MLIGEPLSHRTRLCTVQNIKQFLQLQLKAASFCFECKRQHRHLTFRTFDSASSLMACKTGKLFRQLGDTMPGSTWFALEY